MRAESVQKPVERTAQVVKRSDARESARQARRAARERRRYERDEVRRFTRRARHRRLAWITALGVVTLLFATVAIAVYSPLLALTKIEITGTSSVDPAEVLDAVDGQLGTPLALVDSDRLTRELAAFTLIQSYVTETVPPHTLVIHITERTPIGSIATAAGFTVVDPAGVTITTSSTRPEGMPTIELAGADVDSDVFDSVVEVLLALPDSVGPNVDRVMAATKDDVTLVLSGAGQQVVWGSAEDSDLKARVLAALMATQDPNARIEYDVSAPLSAVIRPI
jgi:cell division protein FtsQ